MTFFKDPARAANLSRLPRRNPASASNADAELLGSSPQSSDPEAQAIVEEFETLYAGLAPAPPPEAPALKSDDFRIEFPEEKSAKSVARPVPHPVQQAAIPLRPSARPEPIAAPLPTRSKGRASPLAPPGIADGTRARRRSAVIVAGIAVALLVGIVGGYVAGKRETVPVASEPGAVASPELRLDYELTRPAARKGRARAR
jgi:hypothetical protein